MVFGRFRTGPLLGTRFRARHFLLVRLKRGQPFRGECPLDLSGKKIAILGTTGFEQAELEVPRDKLKKAGATVDVVSLAAGEIKGWDRKDWGRSVKVDKTLEGRHSQRSAARVLLAWMAGEWPFIRCGQAIRRRQVGDRLSVTRRPCWRKS